MARRKPFHVESPRIVPADEGRGIWRWLAVLLGLAAWTLMVYQYGLHYAPDGARGAGADTTALLQRIAELETERDQLLARAGEAAEPDTTAAVDEDSADIQRDIEVLRAERDAIAGEPAEPVPPGLAEAELELLDLVLQPAATADGFDYSFRLARPAKGEDKIEGRLIVRARWAEDGLPATALDASEPAAGGAAHRLGFRHFQELSGRLEVPPAVEPAELQIEVELSAPQQGRYLESLPWTPVAD